MVEWATILDYGLRILGYGAGTLIVTLASIIFAKLKTKIGEARLNTYIEKAVQAAEQLFPNVGKKTGKEKYKYVTEQILSKFPKVANDEHLKALIEAAVYKVSEEVKLIAKQKELTTTTETNTVETTQVASATILKVN